MAELVCRWIVGCMCRPVNGGERTGRRTHGLLSEWEGRWIGVFVVYLGNSLNGIVDEREVQCSVGQSDKWLGWWMVAGWVGWFWVYYKS